MPPVGPSARILAAVAVMITTAACGQAGVGAGDGPTQKAETQDAAWVRGDEPWRGLLASAGEPDAGAVSFDGVPSMPATAPAYRLVAPTEDDLRAIAERYAGRPVDEGIMPGGSPDLVSFDVGDGWFHDGGTLGTGGPASAMGTWSWTERREREHPSGMSYDEMQTCPADTPSPTAPAAFLGPLGYDVVPSGRMECAGPGVVVRLDLRLNGLPVAGAMATVVVVDGRVVDATVPFLKVESLGELELAPAAEVLRRLAYGPGIAADDPSCGEESCQFGTSQAELGLAPVSTGGVGAHDHIVNGAVPGPDVWLLVPTLGVVTTTPAVPNTSLSHRWAIALSSALLVDDPTGADDARRADVIAAQAGLSDEVTNGCAGAGERLAVCSSSFESSAGDPVVITVSGEVNEPVGAADCAPVLTLDFGDGTIATAPPPRSGTLVSARTVHAYAASGEYEVTAHRASRCEQPAGGGGTEPEYDEVEHLMITVSG
jgi:hypothetical protein